MVKRGKNKSSGKIVHKKKKKTSSKLFLLLAFAILGLVAFSFMPLFPGKTETVDSSSGLPTLNAISFWAALASAKSIITPTIKPNRSPTLVLTVPSNDCNGGDRYGYPCGPSEIIGGKKKQIGICDKDLSCKVCTLPSTIDNPSGDCLDCVFTSTGANWNPVREGYDCIDNGKSGICHSGHCDIPNPGCVSLGKIDCGSGCCEQGETCNNRGVSPGKEVCCKKGETLGASSGYGFCQPSNQDFCNSQGKVLCYGKDLSVCCNVGECITNTFLYVNSIAYCGKQTDGTVTCSSLGKVDCGSGFSGGIYCCDNSANCIADSLKPPYCNPTCKDDEEIRFGTGDYSKYSVCCKKGTEKLTQPNGFPRCDPKTTPTPVPVPNPSPNPTTPNPNPTPKPSSTSVSPNPTIIPSPCYTITSVPKS